MVDAPDPPIAAPDEGTIEHAAPIDAIADAFAKLPEEHQAGLMALRGLILEVAEEVGAAPVQEVLRWGQPSYLSVRPRESTTIRLGSSKDNESFGLYFHCQSTVLSDFRGAFPTNFRYDGNRAILFRPGEDLQEEKLRLCISHALQYRATKNR